MGIFVIPGVFYPFFGWLSVAGVTAAEKKEALRNTFLSIFLGVSIGAISYILYADFYATEAQRRYLQDGPFKHYAPLIGYLCAELAFCAIGIWPLFFLSTTTATTDSYDHKKPKRK